MNIYSKRLMGNAENKKDFIRELFLYYKPTLTKEKQLLLLKEWIQSCVDKEEYEMASVLEVELRDVECNPEKPVDSTVKVVKIDEILKKTPKNTENTPILPKKPVKKVKKPTKKWKYVNIWEEPFGFVVIDLQFSIKKRTFKFVLLNYGFSYNL